MAPDLFSSHHLVDPAAATADYSAPSSSCTSSSSAPSSTSSPRSSRDGPDLGRPPPPSSLGDDDPDLDPERDFASNTSDSYDSAGEATGVNLRPGAYDSTPNVQYAQWGTDDGSSYYDHSSRFSSRANSPAPPAADQLWDGYRSEPLAYRSISRNRSRNVSGTTTPTSGVDKEGQYSSDCACFVLFQTGGTASVVYFPEREAHHLIFDRLPLASLPNFGPPSQTRRHPHSRQLSRPRSKEAPSRLVDSTSRNTAQESLFHPPRYPHYHPILLTLLAQPLLPLHLRRRPSSSTLGPNSTSHHPLLLPPPRLLRRHFNHFPRPRPLLGPSTPLLASILLRTTSLPARSRRLAQTRFCICWRLLRRCFGGEEEPHSHDLG